MRATPYLVDALHLLTEFNECFAKVQVQQVVLSNWEYLYALFNLLKWICNR